MVLKKNDFWKSNYYNNPPLDTNTIKQAEKQLGVKLPGEFLDLLKIQNGGFTKEFVFPTVEQTSWADDHVALNELNGIVLDPDFVTAHNILRSGYLIKEGGLPPNQVVLTGEGGWWICLDYRKSRTPSVRWIDRELEMDVLLAKSFEEFLGRLIPKSQFTG